MLYTLTCFRNACEVITIIFYGVYYTIDEYYRHFLELLYIAELNRISWFSAMSSRNDLMSNVCVYSI